MIKLLPKICYALPVAMLFAEQAYGSTIEDVLELLTKNNAINIADNNYCLNIQFSFVDKKLDKEGNLVPFQKSRKSRGIFELGDLYRYNVQYEDMNTIWIDGKKPYVQENRECIFDGTRIYHASTFPSNNTDVNGIKLRRAYIKPEGTIERGFSALQTGQYFLKESLSSSRGINLIAALQAINSPEIVINKDADGTETISIDGSLHGEENSDILVKYAMTMKDGIILSYVHEYKDKNRVANRTEFKVTDYKKIQDKITYPTRAEYHEYRQNVLRRHFIFECDHLDVTPIDGDIFTIVIPRQTTVHDSRLNLTFESGDMDIEVINDVINQINSIDENVR